MRRPGWRASAAIAVALGGVPTAHPDWNVLFNLVFHLLQLADFENASEPVRRVEAAARRDTFPSLCEKLSLENPPVTRGASDAWHLLMEWGVTQLRDLASGKSATFGRVRDVRPEQKILWKKFADELEKHPIPEWEFYGHLSGWPQHRNQLYKLMLRRAGGRRQWWWFEEEISQVPHDYAENYRNAPAKLRLSGSALLLDMLDAQCGTPLGDDKPAIAQAIAEVRRKIEELHRGS